MSAMSWRASHHGQRSGDRLAPYRRPHLLVAHGERRMRDGLTGILSRAGYDVDDTGDIDQALALLDKGEVDALLVSSRLPPDGWQSLLDARETLPPVVVLGNSEDDTTEINADVRVESVLMRMFSLQALYDAVAKASRQSGSP
jgi:DNA-binding response OmpR family regulator